MMVREQSKIADHSTKHTGRKRRWITVVTVTAFCASACVVWHFNTTGQPPFLHRESVWSIAIYEGPTPYDLRPITTANQPVLTAREVDDVRALFVADPFMVQTDDRWLMFVEVLNSETSQGDIGLASSDDGLTWQYDQLVLDEPFHLSYPSVFRWNDRWYMLPEASASGEVRLYEAVEFPTQWQHTKTILTGKDLADPTIFRHDDTWWMYVGVGYSHDTLRLFYADDLFGDWTEHPRSPLIQGDADTARPGGSVVKHEGQLYRFAQDCSPRYGNALRCFRITSLSRTEYAEELIDEAPILRASGTGWNAVGMHHNDPHQLPDGSWRAVVDGHTKIWHLQSTP